MNLSSLNTSENGLGYSLQKTNERTVLSDATPRKIINDIGINRLLTHSPNVMQKTKNFILPATVLSFSTHQHTLQKHTVQKTLMIYQQLTKPDAAPGFLLFLVIPCSQHTEESRRPNLCQKQVSRENEVNVSAEKLYISDIGHPKMKESIKALIERHFHLILQLLLENTVVR